MPFTDDLNLSDSSATKSSGGFTDDLGLSPKKKGFTDDVGIGGKVNGYWNLIKKAASKYELDPDFLSRIVNAESGNQNNRTSPKGAKGLMQLMPGTAKDLGVKDPMDPAQNIDGGARYIKGLLDKYDGDTDKALAAYNWGPGNVDKHGTDNLPKETRNYIRKINGKRPSGATREWAPEPKGIVGKAKQALSDLQEYVETPTAPPESVGDFFTRVIPESAVKTAVGAVEFPFVAGNQLSKGFAGAAETLSSSRGTVGEAWKSFMDPVAEISEGVRQFTGKPLGFYGGEEAKEAWTTDPVGSALAVAPLVKPAAKGIMAAKERIKPMVRQILDETVKRKAQEVQATPQPVTEMRFSENQPVGTPGMSAEFSPKAEIPKETVFTDDLGIAGEVKEPLTEIKPKEVIQNAPEKTLQTETQVIPTEDLVTKSVSLPETKAPVELESGIRAEQRRMIVSDMSQSLKEGKNYGLESVNEGGGWETRYIGSSNPNWLPDFMEAFKKDTKKSVTKTEIQSVLVKMDDPNAKALTDKQIDIRYHLDNFIKEMQNRGDFRDMAEDAHLSEKGFVRQKGTIEGYNIDKGDRFVIDGEEFKATGIDDNGNVTLKDGTTRKVGPDDSISFEAIKKEEAPVPEGIEEPFSFEPEEKTNAAPPPRKHFSEESGELEGFTYSETFGLTPGPGRVGEKPKYGKKQYTGNLFQRSAEENLASPVVPSTKVQSGKGLDALASEYRKEQQKGAFSFRKKQRQTPTSFADPNIEKRFSASNGAPGEGIANKASEWIRGVGNRIARSYEAIPNTGEFAELQFTLKSLEKQREVAKDSAIREIGEITSELNGNSYDVFRRKVILDDLSGEAAKGRNLPYGFDQASVAAEKSRFDALAANDPKVTSSLAKRKAAWDKIKQDYTGAMNDIGFDVSDRLSNDNYYRHQVLEYANLNGIFGSGKKLKTPTSRGFLKKRQGSQKDINSNYLEAEYQVMGQMLHDIEVAKAIKKLGDEYDIAKKVRADANAKGLKNWEDAIPDGYTTWQPREGSVFYMVDTVPAKLAAQIQAGIVKSITGADLKESVALGGKRKQWVVKQEIAETLNNIAKELPKSAFLDADKKILGAWKQWQLIQPRRWFKYNTRNMTGDAEAVFIGNPSAFKKSPRAVKELYDVFVNKKSMSPEMHDWFNRGGMNSTLQVQEMGDLNSLWMFKKLYEKEYSLSDIPGKAWAKYWKAARVTTDAREAVLRYSAYLDYLDQMKGNNGTPKNFGASRPDEIMALQDIKDRAYWLANDLLGAYDRVGIVGNAVRDHAIPFWSWQEVNMKRYMQLFKNSASNGTLASSIGKKFAVSTPLAALRVGRLVLQASAVTAALAVYNNLMYPDLEDKLPDAVKKRPHIILGQDKNGETLYFSRLGILGDALEWFGVDGVQKEVRRFLNGEITVKELAKNSAIEFVKGPLNILQAGAFPLIKTGMEIALRRSTYPDITKPSTIRDRGEHLARAFGLENEYKLLAGKPSAGYAKSVRNVFVYGSDPLESAYRETFDIKREYLKKQGKTSEGFFLTPAGDALYNMKLALRYQDKKALKKYLGEYMQIVTNGRDVSAISSAEQQKIKKGIASSIERMHPLSGIKKEDIPSFLNQLKPEEKEKLKDAIKFYRTSLLWRGGKQDE